MCICIPNIKFLCLTMCQGEVCTDDDANDANANDDGQSMIVSGSLVDKPNEPKSYNGIIPFVCILVKKKCISICNMQSQ